MSKKVKLTKADEICVRAHTVEGLSKSDAFRKAFPKRIARWKDKTVNNKAYEFFERGEIRGRLNEIVEEAKKQTSIDHAYVLKRFNELESFNFKDLFDEHGCMKPIGEWPDSLSKTIVSIEASEIYSGVGEDRGVIGHVTKIRIESRTKALESIAKHLKFYPDANVTVNPGDGMIEMLNRVANGPMGSPQGRLAANARGG